MFMASLPDIPSISLGIHHSRQQLPAPWFAHLSRASDSSNPTFSVLGPTARATEQSVQICVQRHCRTRAGFFTVREHPLPSANTAVSRQIRGETLGLFEPATAAFWSSHIFYIPVSPDELYSMSKRRKIIHKKCSQIPHITGMHGITTRLRPSTRSVLAPLEERNLTVSLDGKGLLSWSCRHSPCAAERLIEIGGDQLPPNHDRDIADSAGIVYDNHGEIWESPDIDLRRFVWAMLESI